MYDAHRVRQVTYYVFDRNLFTAMSEAIVTYLVWESGNAVLQLVEVYVRTRRRYYDYTTKVVERQTWLPNAVRTTLVMEGCTYEGCVARGHDAFCRIVDDSVSLAVTLCPFLRGRWVWLLVADWIIHSLCAVVSVLVFMFNVVFLRFGYNAKFYAVRCPSGSGMPVAPGGGGNRQYAAQRVSEASLLPPCRCSPTLPTKSSSTSSGSACVVSCSSCCAQQRPSACSGRLACST